MSTAYLGTREKSSWKKRPEDCGELLRTKKRLGEEAGGPQGTRVGPNSVLGSSCYYMQ